jgi:hypothetical protein
MKLMVVLGAGASYDSIPERHALHLESRPPLANGLFDAKPNYARHLLDLQFAAAIASRGRASVESGRPLEQFLEELRSEAERDPVRLKQLLAVKFYLRAILRESDATWMQDSGGATNYAALVDIIESCRLSTGGSVCYVTFNYDMLLEHGLATRGTQIGDLSSYVNGPTPLFKVHGSITWGQVVTCDQLPLLQRVEPKMLCELADRLHDTDDYVVAYGELQGQSGSGAVVVPAIAVPTMSKYSFACPPSHIEALKAALPEVGGIVTIGWRGAEEHFLRLLGDNLGHQVSALVVSGSQTGCSDTAANLTRAGVGISGKFDRGFTELLEDDVPGPGRGQVLRTFVSSVLRQGRPGDDPVT